MGDTLKAKSLLPCLLVGSIRIVAVTLYYHELEIAAVLGGVSKFGTAYRLQDHILGLLAFTVRSSLSSNFFTSPNFPCCNFS
jgi:hypothetical protein